MYVCMYDVYTYVCMYVCVSKRKEDLSLKDTLLQKITHHTHKQESRERERKDP